MYFAYLLYQVEFFKQRFSMSSWFSQTSYSNDFILAYYNRIKQRFVLVPKQLYIP